MKRFGEYFMLALVLALAIGVPGFSLTYPEVREIPQGANLTVSQSHVIVVQGGLNFQSYGQPTTDLGNVHMLMAMQIATGADHIDMLINSGGGAYTSQSEALFSFMEYLKARDVPVRCIVDGMAASLAAILLSHCGERYATSISVIMVHGARASGMGGLNSKEASALSDQLANMDDEIWETFRDLIDDTKYWNKNFQAERMIPAAELALKYPDVLTLIDTVMVTP